MVDVNALSVRQPVRVRSDSLIETGVNGVSNHPERILGVAAERRIESNQDRILNETIIYDNRFDQPISSGSIIIDTKK
jgi:hypothetical protein